MRALIVIVLWCLQIIIMRAEDERIWIDATINGHPARFAFDTGDPGFYTLFRTGAQRLGMVVANHTFPEDTNNIYVGYTPGCLLKIDNQALNVGRFWVMDVPPPFTNSFSADGLIGWPYVTNRVVAIDANADKIRFGRVPRHTTGWLKLPIQSGAPVLRLLVSKPNGKKTVIVVDTGARSGVALRPDLWREWKSSHTNQPTTLVENYLYGPGIIVREETWAKEIGFGPLTLTDVPVIEASSVDLGLGGEDYEATLGLAALKRLDLVVDARHGVAYLRPKSEKPARYKHNRLAVCFAPLDLKSTNCIAHVLKNGPGYAAGIRDGDILLNVDGCEIANFGELVSIGKKEEEQPEGTRVTLTLMRRTKVFETSVVLKDILKP